MQKYMYRGVNYSSACDSKKPETVEIRLNESITWWSAVQSLKRLALFMLRSTWEDSPTTWREKAHCSQIDSPILVKKYTVLKYVSIYSIGDKEWRNRPQTLSGSLGICARVAFSIFVNLYIFPINVYFIIEKIQKVYIILSSQNGDVHHYPFGVRTPIPTYSSLYVYTCVRCVCNEGDIHQNSDSLYSHMVELWVLKCNSLFSIFYEYFILRRIFLKITLSESKCFLIAWFHFNL